MSELFVNKKMPRQNQGIFYFIVKEILRLYVVPS